MVPLENLLGVRLSILSEQVWSSTDTEVRLDLRNAESAYLSFWNH